MPSSEPSLHVTVMQCNGANFHKKNPTSLPFVSLCNSLNKGRKGRERKKSPEIFCNLRNYFSAVREGGQEGGEGRGGGEVRAQAQRAQANKPKCVQCNFPPLPPLFSPGPKGLQRCLWQRARKNSGMTMCGLL